MPFKPIPALFFIATIWILCSGNTPAPQEEPQYVYGLSLNTGMNNQVFTLFVVKMDGMHVVSTEPITREQFVLQAQGVVPGKANPGKENLFKKFKVEPCVHPDSGKYWMDCPVFDDLWRLRFKSYPFRIMDGGTPPDEGWAGREASPTPAQMVLLADYGLLRLSGMIKGIDVFRLLHDVSDSTWVEKYRSSY
jgi:hypothetical protein